MASCLLTQSIPIPCQRSTGGIKRIFITDFATAQNSIIATGTTGVVAAITGTTNWYAYDFRKQTGTFTEKGTLNEVNNSLFYTPTVSLIMNNLSTNLRNEFYQLAQLDTVVIVRDQMQSYWLIGYTNGLVLSAFDGGAGKAGGDHNGYTLTLEGMEPVPMYNVPATVMAQFETAFPDRS